MPRKTAAIVAVRTAADDASMRPRPDAAENSSVEDPLIRAYHALQ